MQYVSKVGKVYVTTLATANTWYVVLTEAQVKAARGIKIKPRYTHGQTTQKPFDIAFSATPDTTGSVTDGTGFISDAGGGFADVFAPSSGIWARSAVAGTILEVIVYG